MKQLITAFSIRVKTTVSVPARTAFIIVNALVVFEALTANKTWMNANLVTRVRTTPPVSIYRDRSPVCVHQVSQERDANKKKKPVFHLHVGIKVYVKMILKIIVIPVSVDPATMAVIVRIT